MKAVIKYEAFDGTLFDTESACRKYAENRAYSLTSKITSDMNISTNGNPTKMNKFIMENIDLFVGIKKLLDDANEVIDNDD